MAQMGTLYMKKLLRFCSGRVLVLHLSLYMALKLMHPMDVDGIVLDERMGTRILRQPVGFLTPAESVQIVSLFFF